VQLKVWKHQHFLVTIWYSLPTSIILSRLWQSSDTGYQLTIKHNSTQSVPINKFLQSQFTPLVFYDKYNMGSTFLSQINPISSIGNSMKLHQYHPNMAFRLSICVFCNTHSDWIIHIELYAAQEGHSDWLMLQINTFLVC